MGQGIIMFSKTIMFIYSIYEPVEFLGRTEYFDILCLSETHPFGNIYFRCPTKLFLPQQPGGEDGSSGGEYSGLCYNPLHGFAGVFCLIDVMPLLFSWSFLLEH